MRRQLTLLLCAAVLAIVAMVVVVPPALAAPAGIFTGDVTSQVQVHVDPIVSPGARSAHEHCFYGGGPVSTTETSAGLRSKATSWDVQATHTAIWIPCVYENGVLLRQATQHGILAYYKPIAGTECVPPENTGGVTHEYGYRGQTGGGSFSPMPPSSTSSGDLVIDLVFRGGRDFGVPCFVTIEVFIRLNVGSGSVGRITVGGPVAGVDGATGPETMHGDYLFGWDRAAFERFLAACVRPARACGRNPTP